jgi:hypothetical protein
VGPVGQREKRKGLRGCSLGWFAGPFGSGPAQLSYLLFFYSVSFSIFGIASFLFQFDSYLCQTSLYKLQKIQKANSMH